MNWKQLFKREKRSGVSPTTLKSPATWLLEIFGQSPNEINVNWESSLTHSAVWSCVRVLSETIASLPFHVYERNADGSRSISQLHPVNFLISQEPNPNQTSFTFRETAMMHLSLLGNAYAIIIRNGVNRPVQFVLVNNHDVEIKIYNGDVIYKVNGYGLVDKADMIHIPALAYDGIVGLAPIAAAMVNIQLGLAAQDFGYKFFKNGANLNGYITVPEVLTDDAYLRLKNSWDQRYSGHGKNSQTAILEQGSKYERIGIPPEDAQFLETRKFQINDIARIFRVPPHMIADLERATFSNIEHQAIDFVTHTITPWLVRWEQEFNRKVFRQDEKSRFYVKFNMNALMRGDAQSRSEYYSKLFQIGAMSQNDIRSLEDLNAIEGGDRYYVPMNMVPIDKVDEMITPEPPEPTKIIENDGTESGNPVNDGGDDSGTE